MDFKEKFKKVLREARIECGLSQEALARAVDTTTMTMRRWDTGSSLPRVDQYLRLIEVLGDGIHYSLFQKTPPKKRKGQPHDNVS